MECGLLNFVLNALFGVLLYIVVLDRQRVWNVITEKWKKHINRS
jgi:hypothetical protein